MNKRRFPIIALSTSTAVAILLLCSWFLTMTHDYPSVTVNKDWTVTVGNEEYPHVNLSEIHTLFKTKPKRGDTLIMTREIPYIGDIPIPAIIFRSHYSAFECYLDDTLIYEYGLNKYIVNKFVGKKYHFITLPRNYRWSHITFKITACEKGAFSYFDPIYLGNHPDLLTFLISKNQFVILIGMFLFVFGMFLLTLSLLFVSYVPELKIQLFASLLCINIGLYLICYSNMMSIFVDTDAETEIEYFTLFLFIPLIYIVLYFMNELEKKKLMIGFFIASVVIPMFQQFLYYTFSVHLKRTLLLFDINAVIVHVIIVYCFVRTIRQKKTIFLENLQMVGMFVLSSSGFIHLIGYTMTTYRILPLETTTFPIIGFGALFYAMTQLTYYLLYITKTYAQRKEHESLIHLAYADGLTDLPNRANADKELKALDHSNFDYCIISIDLNGLKPVNDKLGHAEGDKYILDFSKILKSTFEEYGMCARIGGDEFIVIIRDADSLNIDELITKMSSALDVLNALYPTYVRSVATGYAYSHERPGKSSHEVYLLADRRMYENKKIMHEKLGIEVRM